MLRKFKKFHLKIFPIFLCSVLFLHCGKEAFSLPQVEEVVSGNAQITQPTSTTLQINAQNNTIINYSSFNINENESVVINLPSADAQILNRVLGNSASQLLGNLNSNGLFILVNPSGIYIGPKATIDAASIVMSTRDINNADFQNGNYLFQRLSQEQLDQLLLNEGNITIQKGGFGVLIAGGIENKGKIIAQAGTVALASGDAVRLDIAKGGLISVAIEKETASQVLDSQGNPVTDQIKNTGTIENNGGTVILDADSVSGVFKNAINLEGYVTANRVESKDGVIRIVADQNVNINATVQAANIQIGDTTNKIPENVEVAGGSLEAEKNITILAKNNIKTNTNLTTQKGDIKILADQDADGKGSFTQGSGTIYAQDTGNIYIDASETMSLLKLKTDDGFIKIGTQRTPKEITGSPYYIHAKGHFEINKKSENNNLATLETKRGDILKYNTQGSLTLEAQAGKVLDLTDSVLKANTLKLTGQEFLVNTQAANLEIYKTLNDFVINKSSQLEGFITLEGENIKIVYPVSSKVTIRAEGPIRTANNAVISAQTLNLISNKFGDYQTPLRVSASELVINRLSGMIEILDNKPMDSDILVRGPPANSFGAVLYNKDAHLTLKAEKVTFSSSEPSYLYGNITFYNFSVTIPDKELYFEPGKTYTFKNSLEIIGAPDLPGNEQMVKMWSQVPGEKWNISVESASYNLNYINIQDANNINSQTIVIPIGVDRRLSGSFYVDPTWDGGGGSTDYNWSTAANWTGDTVPATTDAVTFDATSTKNCTVDALGTWSAGNLTIAAGYTGTITVNVAMTIGNFSIAAGTFDVQNVTININGTTAMTGGTYNTGTAKNTFGNDAGDTITFSGGTFNIESDATNTDIATGGGTISINGGTVAYVSPTAVSTKLLSGLSPYNNLEVNSSGSTYTLNGNITASGNFTITAGTVDVSSANNYSLTVTGNYANSGTFTPRSGTVTFGATSGTQTLNGGGSSFNNISHNQAGTLQLLTNALTVGGTFTNSAGTFDADTNDLTLTVTGLATVSGGTFTASSSATATFDGGLTISGGTFTGAGGAVDVNGVLTLSSGTLTAPSGAFTVSGNWAVSGGTFTPGSNTVTFDGIAATTQTLNSGAQSFNNISHSGASILQLLTNALTVGGTFTNSAGTFDADTNDLTLTVTGLATVSGGTFTASSSATATFNGGLTVSGGTFTGAGGAVDVNGALTLSSGTLTAPSGAFTVSGNWANTGGTFTSGSNTVTFDGSGTQTLNSGGVAAANQFNNFTHSGSGTLQLITNNLLITGNFTNSAGTFDVNDLTIAINGNTTISSGTYQTGTNTNTFGDAAGDTVTVSSGTFTIESDNTLLDIIKNAGTWTNSGGTISYSTATDVNTKLLSSLSPYNHLELGSTLSTYTLDGAITINGNYQSSGPTLDTDSTNNYAITIKGGWTNISGKFTPNLGTVTFSEGAADVSGINTGGTGTNKFFYNLTHNGTGILQLSGNDIDINGNFTNSGGTFDASGGGGRNMSVAGNWSNTATFTSGSNTVTFDGGSGTQTLNSGGTSSGKTFNNLTHSGASTLQLLTNAIQIDGTFTNSAGTFDADTNDLVITVTGLSTISGGTFTASSSATATFNGGLTVSGGTFTGAGGAVDVNGVLTLSSGTLTAPSGAFTVSGNWAVSGGTFTPGSNTVTFDATSGTQTLNSGAQSFNNISHNQAGTLQLLTNALTVGGTFTNSAGTFDADTNDLVITVTGLSTISGGTFTASSSATATFNGGLTVSGGTFTGAGGAVDVNGVLTLSSGTLTAPSGAFTVSGNWAVSGGTFTPGSNTVTFDATSGTQTLNSGAQSFNNISHNQAGTLQLLTNALTVGGTLTNSAGTFDADTNDLTLTVTGLATVSGGTFTASSSATATFNGGLTVSGGTFTGAGGAVDVNGALTLSSGTLTAPSGAFTVSGNWAVSGGTFTPGSNTVTFDATSGTQTLNSGAQSFNNISHNQAGTLQLLTNALTVGGTFTNSAGTFDADTNDLVITVTGLSTISGGTFTASSSATATFNSGLTVSGGTFTGAGGAVDVNGDLTLSSGTLTASSGAFTVSGNWAHSGGTFTAGTGTVTLDGSGASTISGSTTFYNLTNTTAGKQLTFTAGTTQTITNTLTFTGAAGNLIKLRSSSSGSQWKIDPQGTRSVTFVDVKDSNNINTLAINVKGTGSTDSGNSTNWDFGSRIAGGEILAKSKNADHLVLSEIKNVNIAGVIKFILNKLFKADSTASSAQFQIPNAVPASIAIPQPNIQEKFDYHPKIKYDYAPLNTGIKNLDIKSDIHPSSPETTDFSPRRKAKK